MSHPSDYRDDMSRSGITDSEIEMLISGAGEGGGDPDLRAFVATLARPVAPPRDVEHMATALAATARSTAPRKRARGLRRLTVLAGTGAFVVALGGVAMAADGSIPGDTFYGLDRTLESFGIGDGGVDERIEEFDALVAAGQENAGYTMLAEVIETAEGVESERAQRHLELAATKTSPNAEAAQVKVAWLQEFIDANKGAEGANGIEFGQEVSRIARSTQETPSDADEVPNQTESTQDGQPGNSADAPGQQDDNESTSEPAETSGSEEQPGKSDDAPGKQNDTANSNDAPGQQKDDGGQTDSAQTTEPEEQPSDDPGNSANAPGQEKDNGNSANAPGQQKDE